MWCSSSGWVTLSRVLVLDVIWASIRRREVGKDLVPTPAEIAPLSCIKTGGLVMRDLTLQQKRRCRT